MSAERIAFVRMGPHPIPNRLLPPELERRFADSELCVLDLERAVRRDPLAMMVNAIFVVVEHGVGLLTGRVRRWPAFFTTTWMFRRMSRLARRWIESGDFDFSMQMQSLFDASVPGTPHFVYTDHTHLSNLEYPDFEKRDLRGERWLALERDLYRNAELVFTRSSNVSNTLIDAYGCSPEQVETVGAGTNVEMPEESSADCEGVHILFVGVDWERKGGPDLLDAFGRLLESHPEARLSIVGCAPEVSHPRVEVVGRRSLDELPDYYASASIFCMPTRREPFGVVFVEAMHHGLPIVATRVGALPDLVVEQKTGLLVDVGDVDGLTRALAALSADADLRRRMGSAARTRAREGYTWRSVARRMEMSIRRVLESVDDSAGARSSAVRRLPRRGTSQRRAVKMG